MYLWAAKDLAWTQDWYYTGMVFGGVAVAWSFVLLGRAVLLRNWNEVVHYIAQFVWLFGNYWWMWGELSDWFNDYDDDVGMYNERQRQSGIMMLAALVYLGVARLPYVNRLFKTSAHALSLYDEPHLKPHRWLRAVFPTWRSYENIHIFFWLGKDAAWNHSWGIMWWIFSVPTVLLSLDFCYMTSFYPSSTVDHLHYVVQLLWVGANLVWAWGEIYGNEDFDDPSNLFPHDAYYSVRSARWYSGWILVLAFLIVLLQQILWVGATLAKALPRSRRPRNFSFSGRGSVDVVGGGSGVGGRVVDWDASQAPPLGSVGPAVPPSPGMQLASVSYGSVPTSVLGSPPGGHSQGVVDVYSPLLVVGK